MRGVFQAGGERDELSNIASRTSHLERRQRGKEWKEVKTDHAPAAIGAYSQGIIANGFLYTAGQIPHRSGFGAMTASE
jgi:hypothetical protein